MKSRIVGFNLLASVFLQITTILNGLIVPRVILGFFGSEVNGLVSSIDQFLNYITIMEGGVGSVIVAALYKPLLENDEEKISRIITASRLFFRKIAIIYIAYVVIFAFIYPAFVHIDLSYEYIVALVFVLAINLFTQYYFSISLRLLLLADRKVYIVRIWQGIVVLLNMATVVFCANVFHDILLLKLISSAVFCIVPIAYNVYVKKHYIIHKDDIPDNQTLSQRWDGFGINLAYFIHANTDIVILTLLSSLKDVSIYAIYLNIVTALRNFVFALSSSISPSFGRIIAEGNVDSSNSSFDMYQFGIYYITSILFSCGIVLVTPFVSLYTSGISDANYYQPSFGVVLMISEMIYCLRDPMISVAYSSGNFKPIAKYAYIEAGLNIIISIFGVLKFGLLGVAIGTTIAMAYRTIMQAVFASKNVLFRPLVKFVKENLIYGVTITFICLMCDRYILTNCTSYFVWALNGVKVFLFAGMFVSITSVVFYRNQFRLLIQKFLAFFK